MSLLCLCLFSLVIISFILVFSQFSQPDSELVPSQLFHLTFISVHTPSINASCCFQILLKKAGGQCSVFGSALLFRCSVLLLSCLGLSVPMKYDSASDSILLKTLSTSSTCLLPARHSSPHRHQYMKGSK